MHVRKRLFTFLFAALAMLLCTACGKWDYSREAMKAANDAQGQTLRVEFKVNQTFTNALRAAAEDNIQPADVDKAMTMDKSIEKLLTSGYRLDVYALRADIDADKAAAQLADEFVNRLAGCEDEGYIGMVKAENGYFYMAVLPYKHGGGSSGGDDGAGDTTGDDSSTGTSWVTLENGVLTLRKGAIEHIGSTLDGIQEVLLALVAQDIDALKKTDRYKITEELINNGQLNEDNKICFFCYFYNVTKLVIYEESGITTIGDQAAGTLDTWNKTLQSVELHGVKTIGLRGLYALANLKEVCLYDVENVGHNAFGANQELVGIYLPNVTTVDEAAFSGCLKLVHIGFGSQLRSVGCSAFEDVSHGTSDQSFTIYYSTGSEDNIQKEFENIDEHAVDATEAKVKFEPFDEFPDEFK